jgi:hypothetical protein
MRVHCLLALVVTSCGSSSIGDPDGIDAQVGPADARPAGGDGGGCTTAYECTPPMVCNPANASCVANLACASHTACGNQAFCQESGTCAPNALRGPCDTDNNCVGQERCDNGRCGCGGELLTATAVAPNMLLTVDRSGSMVTNDVPGTGDSRWTVARRVIRRLTQQYQEGIRFGLSLWPGREKDCEDATSQTRCRGIVHGVAMATGTASAIGGYIDTATTCGLGTPIGGTLDTLVTYAPLGDESRDNYVVLVTDGGENCDGNGPDAARDLGERDPPVRTFVIGFGGDVDASQLNALALAGGTARPTMPYYYQADNEAALEAAFDQIAGEVATCTYTLSSNPGDPTRIFVFLDGNPIARDTSHANGWDYEPAAMRLTFYGAACSSIRGGGELSVSFGCAIIP